MMQEARYTSPSGAEITFAWEAVQRKTELKTGIYTFPGRDGAHVQHQGAGARSFPLGCIFYGKKYMQMADAFEEMLIERGVGELQHPVYGTIKVVPTGGLERIDDPVQRFGESIVRVTFTETIAFEHAAGLGNSATDVLHKKLDEFSEAAAADFASALVISDAAAQAAASANLDKQTQSIIDSLRATAMADKKGFKKWLAAASEIKDGIKNIYQKAIEGSEWASETYSKALNIGRQILWLMKLPSTHAVSIAEKIKGFSALTANLINQYKNDPVDIEKMKTAYETAKLAIDGACAAIVSGTAFSIAEIAAISGAAGANESVANTGVASREEAINAVNETVKFYEDTITFSDQKIGAMNEQSVKQSDMFIDATPEAHIALAELVYASTELILNASFALPMQKTITLCRDRQIVELCSELYGNTEYLDEFIAHNNFNIDEIELIPMGRRVSYYVKSA